MKKIIALSIILIFIVAACSGGPKPSQEAVDEFAKCLTEKGVTMYGTFWCPHCAKTKAKFGPSFQYIDYVECDARGDNEQSELCIEREIEGYDTWEFADGSRILSEPSFDELAEKSGCSAPVANGG